MTGPSSRSRPAIALLIETDGPGGAETMLLHLAEGLRARGYPVVPMGPADGSGWLSSQLHERGFRRETFDIHGKADPRALWSLVRTLRRRNVGVVHAHEFQLAVYGAAAAGILNIPHVITLHGSRYYRNRWHRQVALRRAALTSRCFAAVSEAFRSELEGDLDLPPGVVEVIPNGVPQPKGTADGVRRELGLAPGEALILAVGNLYPVKGHDVLLRALGILQRSRPDLAWQGAVAGRGGEEERLRSLCDELHIEHRVHLLGFRSDVPDLLEAARVWVMASRSEGHPLALLEAMLTGIPVVASRVGGIPEVVADGETALLVPPDDPASLSKALERLLTDPGLRVRIARNARRRALERFSLDAMVTRYEEAYGVRSSSSGPPPLELIGSKR